MQGLTEAYLEEVLERNRAYTKQGKVADYIPELSRADASTLGLSIHFCSGEKISAGDSRETFTLQSMSKVLALLLALEDNGEEKVFDKVGMEPTGDPFNSIIKLEILERKKPFNPMINAGAIAIASLIKGRDLDEKFSRILEFIRRIAGNPKIRMNEKVYLSEKETGDRNRALAYFMRDTGTIERGADVEEILDLYFRYNSVEVDCEDLARIGCFLATHGKLGKEDNPLVSSRHIRSVLSIMMTSGMYNASGEFALAVGIPAKSGVSGGIFAAVPGKMGIGVLSPAIDEKGNSVAGVQVLKELSREWDLNIFS